jgi:Tfp pilus assembly protein PilX
MTIKRNKRHGLTLLIKKRKKLNARRGAALLIVLGVVMVITIVAFAYLSRSDGELQYGHNMLLRTQADYLAESALEHARGLILNPQEIDIDDGWTATSQQLETGDFYYDVTAGPNGLCGYDITCRAYKSTGGERTAQSNLEALLQLNPCIAYWSNSTSSQQLSSAVTIKGDAAGDLISYGMITGEVYQISELPLEWPRVDANDFLSNYSAQVQTIGSPSIGPYSSSGICHCTGDLEITDNVQITGMLIVEGDLQISGTGNLVRAGKALPAMLVTGDVIIEQGTDVDIEGLVVVDGRINIKRGSEDVDVNILGGLFAKGGIVETISSTDGQQAIINGEPEFITDSGHIGISFDGSDDFAQTEDNSTDLQITNNYTFAVWLKAGAAQKKWAGIFSKTSPDGSVNHWTLQFDSSSPKKLIVYHSSSSWFTGIKIDDIKGSWHHIAITRNGNTMTAYLDGVAKSPGTWFSSPGSGNGHLNIGVDRTASSSYTYSGMIDDMRIFNQPLDINDVNRVMNGSDISNGLIAHWKLDEDGQRQFTITAAPAKTAIWCWSQSGERQKWAQAAAAFYKVIRRN